MSTEAVDPKPVEADLRHEDEEYNPAIEPKKSRAWLNLLRESEKAFSEWNEACDNTEKLYANLSMLRNNNRDKQFQMFWANMEVLKPSIYAKPPIPVVVPKFKDRRPLFQTASDVMERTCTVAFDIERINDLMLLVRDDVALCSRGVVWCRYKEGSSQRPEYVCYDFKPRRDFLHSISRNWREVTWVAAASYLTRGQARKRFRPYSGDAYQDAEYRVDKEAKEVGGGDNRERAKFWEIWHKGENRVVWVSEGCEVILDEDEPLLEYKGFFPCPKPAYGNVQPGSLVPVPDVLQYRDQLQEVNTLTGRIHALSDALEVKGFYPAGTSEISDAVQRAINIKTPGRVLVPISNWAAFGGSKEVIIWLPIDMIANAITALVTLRKQIIEDIYQVMGLSDIMRGATDPNETLGAQQLKSQYGTSRIRDKQGEMVRLCRDIVEITTEIVTQNFEWNTILAMCQLDIPTEAQQAFKIQQMQRNLQQQQLQVQQMIQAAKANPQIMQQAQQNPQMVQQMLMQASAQLGKSQEQIVKAQQEPTQEKVYQFIRDYRAKAYVLDIETDSTILADENAEKQRRAEFLTALSNLLPQLASMVAAEPGTAEFAGELLKFSVGPFRVSRSLDGAIDKLVEQMKDKAGQAGNQDPPEVQKIKAMGQIEQQKLQAQKESDDEDRKVRMAEIKAKSDAEMAKISNERALAFFEAQTRRQETMAKLGQIQAKTVQDAQKHEQTMVEGQQDMVLNQQKAAVVAQQAHDRRQDAAAKRNLAERSQIFKESTATMGPIGG